MSRKWFSIIVMFLNLILCMFITAAAADMQVTIQADPESSITVGSTATFQAIATGGAGNYSYQFWHLGPGTNQEFVMVQDYSALDTWTFTPTGEDLCLNSIRVNVLSGNMIYTFTTQYYVLPDPPTSVDLSASSSGSSASNIPIRFTAQASGGTNAYQYQFQVSGPATGHEFQVYRDYSTDNTWQWTPGAEDVGRNIVLVIAKSAGDCSQRRVYTYIQHEITSSGDAPVNLSLAITSGILSPGNDIVFEAGGAENHEFEFWHKSVGTNNEWQLKREYDPDNTWHLTPTETDLCENQVMVKAKHPDSSVSTNIHQFVLSFDILPDAPTGVSLSAIPELNVEPGSPVIFTAQGHGGTGDYEYQFQLSGPATNDVLTVVQAFSGLNTWEWTPSAADNGNYSVRVGVRAQSGCGTAQHIQTMNYKVGEPDPVWPPTGVKLEISEGVRPLPGNELTFTTTMNEDLTHYDYQFFRKSPATENEYILVQDFSSTSHYTWTPENKDLCANAVRVIIRLKDSPGIVTYRYALNFYVTETAPTGIIVDKKPYNRAYVNETVTFTGQASADDGYSFEYMFLTNKHSQGDDWVTVQDFSENNRYTWLPVASDIGTYTVRVYTRKKAGCPTDYLYTYFDYEIRNNYPTIGGTPPVRVVKDEHYTFTPLSSDVESDSVLTFSIENKPDWANFNTETGTLSGTPAESHVGVTTGIRISVTDNFGATSSLSAFDLTVAHDNTPPTISGIPYDAVKNSPYVFQPVAFDIDAGQPLAFSIVNKPDWAAFDETTGALSGTPTDTDVGTHKGISITVTDSHNSSASLSSLFIRVLPYLDSDHDGVEDSVEEALQSDPTDPDSTPVIRIEYQYDDKGQVIDAQSTLNAGKD